MVFMHGQVPCGSREKRMGIEIGLSNCVFGKRSPVEDDFRQLHEFSIRHIEISLQRYRLNPHDKNTISDVCRWLEKYDLQALTPDKKITPSLAEALEKLRSLVTQKKKNI